MHGVGGDPWCKADAVANGLQVATGDVLVIHDADVTVPAEGLQAAVNLIPAKPWVMPHLTVHRLSPSATEQVYQGADPAAQVDYDQDPYHGWVGGGVVVIRRDDYEAVPFDRRFVGWGLEDGSAGIAWDALIGPHCRLGWPLHHLWHPPQERASRRVGNPVSEELWRRYRHARGRPERMRQLVEEGKATAWHE